MGARIAAHFANAGVPSVLLDIVPPGEADRDAAARRGLEAAVQQKPPAFFTKAGPGMITLGNFEDDLKLAADCDWILEAVVEDRAVKRELWEKVAAHARPDAALSTNTSGISPAEICEGFSTEFRRRFLGTHFFNPPRYLHLVELVAGPETDAALMARLASFCDRRLGKGVVPCKDTPNFIGNRIGVFFGATVHGIVTEDGYSVEEADALTGPLIGLPKSASFRLLDIIGLDVWRAVLENQRRVDEGERWRGRYEPPQFLAAMIEKGWLGEKSGQGFYRRVQSGGERVIEALDLESLEYRPARTPEFPPAQMALEMADLGARLRHMVNSDDRAGRFLWKLLADLFQYSAERIPEISDRVVEVDRALRWGFGFQFGPFEMWDAVGFEPAARRMESEGRTLPENVRRMLESGATSFYRPADASGEPRTEYFDLAAGAWEELEQTPGVLRLGDVKRARGVIRENAGASLVDMGDGVLCVEFHSKMNALHEDAFSILRGGLEETERNFEAMIIANQGAHFSAGANLTLLLLPAQEGDFAQIERFLKSFQNINMAIRCASKPVVAAPFGYTLGGGCEVVLHAARAQAAAELQMGLVETGVGLIPAAGGCKQMLLRLGSVDASYKLISAGRPSGSAVEAAEMGLLTANDGITMNPERLIDDAKQAALTLARNYVPVLPREDIAVGGEAAYAKLRMGAWLAHESGKITDHDLVIAEKLALVLSGGPLTGAQTVSEQYLLDLEREAFLSLCGCKKTQDRIAHMLGTGKPLRN